MQDQNTRVETLVPVRALSPDELRRLTEVLIESYRGIVDRFAYLDEDGEPQAIPGHENAAADAMMVHSHKVMKSVISAGCDGQLDANALDRLPFGHVMAMFNEICRLSCTERELQELENYIKRTAVWTSTLVTGTRH